MIKTIFFDIGGVLLKIYPERTLTYLNEYTELPENLLEETFLGEIIDSYERGRLTDDEFFVWYKEKLPQPNSLTKSDFFRSWLELLGEPTETLTLARELAKTYPVWLVSNTSSYHIRYVESKGYLIGFAGKIFSFKIGIRKPAKEFYEKALQIASAKANSTVVIDDRSPNVKAAQAMGFRTIHYQSDPQVRQELDLLLN